MKKGKNMPVWLSTMGFSQAFHTRYRGWWYKAQQRLTPAVDTFDWSRWVVISLLPHLFVVPILVLWVGLETKKCK